MTGKAMRLIPFLLVSALPVFGVITASPTTLAVSMRQGVVYPWIATMYPQQAAAVYDYAFTLSGTGAWTAVLTGTLSTACPGGATPECFTITPASGTGTGTVNINWLAHGAEQLTPGTYTGTLTIGSTAVALSLTVVAANPFYTFYYRSTYPVGCTNPNATGYSFAATCVTPQENPPSAAFTIPAVGGTYIDPVFGGNVKRYGVNGELSAYASAIPFSARDKYLVAYTTDGHNAIYNVSSGATAFTDVADLNGTTSYWDAFDDESIWTLVGPLLKQTTLGGAVTTKANFTSSSGGRPALPDLNVGNGTNSMADDGLLAGNSDTATELIVINTVGLTTVNQESKIWYNTYASGGMSTVNFVDVFPGVDSVTGKRYVFACGNPAASIYSLGSGTTLTFEFNVPNGLWNFYSCSHSGLSQTEDGQQVLYWTVFGTGSVNYQVMAYINKGTSMSLPVEISGGLTYLYTAGSMGGAEHGCIARSLCITSTYEYPGITPDASIASIASSGVCTVTTGTAHGLGAVSSTPAIQIGGSNIAAINGHWTGTITSTTAFTIPTTCAGSYTTNTGTVILDVASTSDYPLRSEVVITWLGHGVYRQIQTRQKPYADNSKLFYYYQIPQAALSRSGRFFAFNTNMGVPDVPAIYVAQTDLIRGGVTISVGVSIGISVSIGR